MSEYILAAGCDCDVCSSHKGENANHESRPPMTEGIDLAAAAVAIVAFVALGWLAYLIRQQDNRP